MDIDNATLEKLEEVLAEDEFLKSNNLQDNNPITQLLILTMHHKDVIDFQTQVINEFRSKQMFTVNYLKQLHNQYEADSLSTLIQQLEQDLLSVDEEASEVESPIKSNSKTLSVDNSQKNVEENIKNQETDQNNIQAIQNYHNVEHSYAKDSANSPSMFKTSSPMNLSQGASREVDSKIQLDSVLAKVVDGNEELKDIHLLENPDKGSIDALNNPVTHTYIYREISNILREQQHTITDFMYKLFLVSINFAKIRNAKSYTVFKSLLNRVRLNS